MRRLPTSQATGMGAAPLGGALSPAEAGRFVTAITTAFDRGELDLSGRPNAPHPGWASMPAVVVADRLREVGMSSVQLRCFITFVAAMDRARDAERLWFCADRVWRHSPWVFDPTIVCTRSFTELSYVLSGSGVSQRHLQDVAAWRIIAESLADREGVPEVAAAIFDGYGNARLLLEALRITGDEPHRIRMLQSGCCARRGDECSAQAFQLGCLSVIDLPT
jgi:hypothetical protein